MLDVEAQGLKPRSRLQELLAGKLLCEGIGDDNLNVVSPYESV